MDLVYTAVVCRMSSYCDPKMYYVKIDLLPMQQCRSLWHCADSGKRMGPVQIGCDRNVISRVRLTLKEILIKTYNTV